uniref:Uncharacterized protein n=1 Tax=Haptolina brevifila TaxID=156173 RepID=A0A7S2NLI3_9EUKA|mmetsp:Transcript_82704/g.165038  ORF Transcript_82704/g.165038 Transcript_82704/m.165038 type:complete len:109 (+) Transcript_82704:1330-1656(+)
MLPTTSSSSPPVVLPHQAHASFALALPGTLSRSTAAPSIPPPQVTSSTRTSLLGVWTIQCEHHPSLAQASRRQFQTRLALGLAHGEPALFILLTVQSSLSLLASIVHD